MCYIILTYLISYCNKLECFYYPSLTPETSICGQALEPTLSVKSPSLACKYRVAAYERVINTPPHYGTDFITYVKSLFYNIILCQCYKCVFFAATKQAKAFAPALFFSLVQYLQARLLAFTSMTT